MVITLRKIGKTIDGIFVAVALIFLTIIVVASSLQVFTRYVLQAAMTGTEELARYCFIWMSMLGGSVAVGRWAHPVVNVLTDRLNSAWNKYLHVFLNLLIISFCLIFIFYGSQIVATTTRQLSSTLHIPMSYVYLSIPLGGVGMIFNATLNILNILCPDTSPGSEVETK